jgi:transcriptional regulator GlxA family with amidase domain
MSPIVARRAIGAALVIALCSGAWYLAQPQVPDGQPPLVTLDATSVATLRDAFNRDAAHVRIIVLPSPT